MFFAKGLLFQLYCTEGRNLIKLNILIQTKWEMGKVKKYFVNH